MLPASAAINWTEITDILDGVGTSLFPSLITLVTAAVPIIIIVTVVAFVTGFLDKILGQFGGSVLAHHEALEAGREMIEQLGKGLPVVILRHAFDQGAEKRFLRLLVPVFLPVC